MVVIIIGEWEIYLMFEGSPQDLVCHGGVLCIRASPKENDDCNKAIKP